MLLNRRPFRNALPSGPSKSGDRNSTLPLPDEFAEVGLSFFDRHSDCHPLCFPVYADSAGDTRHKRDAPYSTAAKDPGQLEMLSAKPISRLVSSCPSTGSGNSPANRGLSGLGSSRQGNRPISAKLRGWRRGFAQSHRTLQRSLPAGRDQLSVSRTAARHTDSESSFIVDMDHCCRNQLFLRCWHGPLRGSAEVDQSCQNQRAEGDPPDPRIHLRRGTSVTPHVRHAPP